MGALKEPPTPLRTVSKKDFPTKFLEHEHLIARHLLIVANSIVVFHFLIQNWQKINKKITHFTDQKSMKECINLKCGQKQTRRIPT